METFGGLGRRDMTIQPRAHESPSQVDEEARRFPGQAPHL